MNNRSEAVNTSSNLNLQAVADVLPLEWTRIDFDYVQDVLVELVFDPDDSQGQPYQIRVDLDIVDRADNLPQARRDFAFWVGEVAQSIREGGAR